MKRFHVHVDVENLEQSIRFYSSLFAAEPTVRKPDYAKWMLDDPRVNFAISERQGGGIQHLGIQAENAEELAEIQDRLDAADATVFEEGQTTCCYAKSEKSWIHDPQGVAWEVFHTMGESAVRGACGPATGDGRQSYERTERSPTCCGPAAA
jgi:catechol 2,3-dioxygenase-like lactoylglutathione lyase family enzyme